MSNTTLSKPFLRDHIRHALHHYFEELEGESIADLYHLVLAEVEVPLLEIVLSYAGNQSRAAKWLGVNRGTLRKLLHKYAISSLKQKPNKSIL
jgi:Fis family transcriptional regulator, factor for inversion stimulation protein